MVCNLKKYSHLEKSDFAISCWIHGEQSWPRMYSSLFTPMGVHVIDCTQNTHSEWWEPRMRSQLAANFISPDDRTLLLLFEGNVHVACLWMYLFVSSTGFGSRWRGLYSPGTDCQEDRLIVQLDVIDGRTGAKTKTLSCSLAVAAHPFLCCWPHFYSPFFFSFYFFIRTQNMWECAVSAVLCWHEC